MCWGFDKHLVTLLLVYHFSLLWFVLAGESIVAGRAPMLFYCVQGVFSEAFEAPTCLLMSNNPKMLAYNKRLTAGLTNIKQNTPTEFNLKQFLRQHSGRRSYLNSEKNRMW